ncbi:MAG: hypothetical protein KDJ52_36080, partial [Anaerolineae bacterium]|nr:hypothetical protein [Anaerolineae bacterium]
QPQPDHSRALEYDLAALLALLHRHPLRLRHGRWLPPWFLKMWGHHSALPPTRPTALGELQTARRRFLHYLAATAGLVNAELRMENEESKPALSPISNLQSPVSILTPAAWLWLHAPPDERTQRLWAAWLQAEADLWHRFRLPGTPWLAAPDQLLAALHPALLDQPLFEPDRFAADLLARRPQLIDLTPPALIEPDEALTEAITQLLTG